LRASDFHWVITNEVDTTTKASDCTYDRIILLADTHGKEYIPGSAAVFRFDTEYGITDPEFVESISDHYPIYAEFRTGLPDDD
jgi:hypothetical protein